MYPHQAERLTQVLEREGLAALVASAAANVLYVTGFQSLVQDIYPRIPLFGVFTPRGTGLVIPVIEAAAVAAEPVAIDHVFAYGDFHLEYEAPPGDQGRRIQEWTAAPHASAAEALAAALETLGVRQGAVGLDDSSLPFDLWHRASERLAPLKVVAAGTYFAEARRVKSPYEIERLARALADTEEGANAVIQMLEPGVTEREAVRVFEETLARKGARAYSSIIAFGDRAAIPAPAASDRALRAGDLVRLELGAASDGYYADIGRTGVLGEPRHRQEQTYEAAQAALDAGIQAIRPGATAGSVFDAVIAAARAAGLPSYRRHHVGHAIGLEPFEPPLFAAGEDTELEPGMVVRLETPYYVVGWGGVTVMDTVLVIRGGARVLNRAARGLIVLD